MTIRQGTLLNYNNAMRDLQDRLEQNQARYIDTLGFTSLHGISGGTFGDLVRAGMLAKEGRGLYRLTTKPMTEKNIRQMLEDRKARRVRERAETRRQKAAANDAQITGQGTQQPLGLVQPKDPEPEAPTPSNTLVYTRAEYEALERRVASLEQLLIRRGVA